MNPITGELYHKSIRSTPISRSVASPFQSSSKFVLSNESIKSVLQPEGTIFYASDNDRFRQDFAAEEREKREAAFQRRQQAHYVTRSIHDARAMERSLSIEAVERQQAERFGRRAELIVEKQRPDFRSAFNPITHEYDSNSKGKVLETHDRLSQMRAQRRKWNIDNRGNGAYNLINGADRRPIY
mmetsp:Transcript_25845/g.45664  ORF Transcript_25845/g.45664 Transcript_25845/m.45664 type:complete len:184 (-) Transcript_25845:6568-7119(-)